jgi:hypothetical protein
MTAFLATYRPISSSRTGREAVAQFGIPPFVDASCRREPDFQSPSPSISALCRGRKFAPRLHPGDVVAYLTTKSCHGDLAFRHWRLVAVLRVLHRFEAHDDAAAWYQAQGLAVPSNCVLPDNPPIEFRFTGGPKRLNSLGDPRVEPERVVRRWDHGYRQRAQDCGVFLATESLYLELHEPATLTEEDLDIFGGRMPGTQNPPRIEVASIDRLLDLGDRRTGGSTA